VSNSEIFTSLDANLFSFGLNIRNAYENLNINPINKLYHRGLTIVLKDLPEERCGFWRDFSGNGFLLSVHDRRMALALHIISPFTYLQLGTVNSVTVKHTSVKRETKHLGKCSDNNYYVDGKLVSFFQLIPLLLLLLLDIITTISSITIITTATTTNNTTTQDIIYNYEMCGFMCLMRVSWLQCHCLVMEKSSLAIPENTGFDGSNITDCRTSTVHLTCMKRLIPKFFTQADTLCPECIPPCNQDKYEVYKLIVKLVINN